MGNIIPPQTRTIDPYSSYNSNIVNQLTRMVSNNTNCFFGTHAMDVSIDTTNPTVGLIVSKGMCFKDDVIIEITDEFYVDMHDDDFYFSSDHFDEIGFYYIALKYTYAKSKPPPEAKITIFRPSERSFFDSGYLFLKAVYVDGTPGNLAIVSVHDYDPENPTIMRTYTQTYISVEETLPVFDNNRDEGRLIYVRIKDNVYFGASQGWIAWDAVKDNLDTIGCPIGSLIYLNGTSADLASASAIETFAIGVVIQEGLSSDGSGLIKLFGKCDNVPVETGRTLSPGDRLYLSENEAGSVTPASPIPYAQFVGVCISFDIILQTCSIWFMPGSEGSSGGGGGGSITINEYTNLLSQSIYNKLTVDEIINDDFINNSTTTATINFNNGYISGKNGDEFYTNNLSETGYSSLIPSCQIMANIDVINNSDISWYISNGSEVDEFEPLELNTVHYFSTIKIPINNIVGSPTIGSIVTGLTSLNTAIVCAITPTNLFLRNVVGNGTFILSEVISDGVGFTCGVNGIQQDRTTSDYSNLYIYAYFNNDAIIDDYGVIYEEDTTIVGFDFSAFDSGVGIFTDLDTTPSIFGHKIWKTNVSVVTIIDFDDGYDGKELTIIFTNSNITIQNNVRIKLASGIDFNSSENSTLKLVYCRVDNKWYEQSRSIN